ncbi:MAG: DUF1501 domain-containing protein [Deltaproteobacteria bacterium]|nr:DUF1501 domain-containing protein [Deltaproteobacteria bacterium]
MMSLSRRRFLQAAGLAAVAPTLLLGKRARANAATGQVKHVLVLNLRGGFRSHCTFNAIGSFQHNPFGAQSSVSGTEWKLGAACGKQSYLSSLGQVPAFADITDQVCVLGSVDANPNGAPEIDHVAGQRRVGTGFPDGENGILSIVGAHHPLYANGFSADVLPPVEIGPSEFGIGVGEYGERRPLSLFGAQNGGAAGGGTTAGWHTELRKKLDERFLAKRSRAYQRRLKAFRLAKENAALFSGMLQDPRLDVVNSPDASDAGVTNGELIQVLGNHDMTDIGDPQSSLSWGADIALALRCFSLGSPMVTVARDVYDMHDIEADAYAPRTEDLVRQLAGLHFLLTRMAHPEGGTYWDKTLVVTTSEFSRNNTQPLTGFNSGNGSDHVGEAEDPARNQALVMMGGVVATGGKLIGTTDENIKATGEVTASRDVLATVLDVLGLDAALHLGDSAKPLAQVFT